MANEGQRVARDLLSKAHSSDNVERIFTEKIQYRNLLLRPTSPPPQVANARDKRRKARQAAKDRKKLKPKPLSSRERRSLGLFDIPAKGHEYAIYEPLNRLWQGYIREVLGSELQTGGQGAAAKLASAEFHGAAVEVVRSRCPGRVGIRGIVVRDRKYVMEIITEKRGLKTVPKEGTWFRISLPAQNRGGVERGGRDGGTDSVEEAALDGHPNFLFDVLGDQMMLRSVDRSNRKFKSHFLPTL